MPKYDLLRNFIKIILWHGCSPLNFLQILRKHFTKHIWMTVSGSVFLEIQRTIRGNLGES